MDSDAGRSMATRLGAGKCRHIEIRWLWIQERVRRGELKVQRVPGESNTADLGTKYLDAHRRDLLCRLAGLRLTQGQLCAAAVIILARAAEAQTPDLASSPESGRSDFAVFIALLSCIFFMLGFVASCSVGRTRSLPARVQAEPVTPVPVKVDVATQTVAVAETSVAASCSTTTGLGALLCDELRMVLKSRGCAVGSRDTKATLVRMIETTSRSQHASSLEAAAASGSSSVKPLLGHASRAALVGVRGRR